MRGCQRPASIRRRRHHIYSRSTAAGICHPLDDARVGDGGNRLLDPLHLNLLKPVVAEVEPVTEDAMRLKVEVVEFNDSSVSAAFLLWPRSGNSVIGPGGIKGRLPN